MIRAVLFKYWRRLRFTEQDVVRHQREKCIGVASAFQPKSIDDLLRGAQLVYDWVEEGKLPADHTHTGPLQ